MDLSAVPYLVISRDLDFGFAQERVYLCICLLDHLVLGVGLNRDEAMKHMIAELETKYDGKLEESDAPDSFEIDNIKRKP